ncbi:MAG: succinylglutamate desuccinylase/aspartoacylase family protein, partial [Glaciecola sp.]
GRANESGVVMQQAQLGDYVVKGDVLAIISNPFGELLGTIDSPSTGVVIGKQNIPLAQEGEAIYHIAYFNKPDEVAEHVEMLQDNLVLID